MVVIGLEFQVRKINSFLEDWATLLVFDKAGDMTRFIFREGNPGNINSIDWRRKTFAAGRPLQRL